MLSMILALAASAAPALAQPALEPFSDLLGRCFSGDAPGGGGIDKHCFEPVYGGQHVRDRHAVTAGGKQVYAGETLYSVENGKITFVYWNSLGGIGRGSAAPAGSQINFSGTIHATPTGKEQGFATVWRKAGDGYEVIDEGSAKARPFRLTD